MTNDSHPPSSNSNLDVLAGIIVLIVTFIEVLNILVPLRLSPRVQIVLLFLLGSCLLYYMLRPSPRNRGAGLNGQLRQHVQVLDEAEQLFRLNSEGYGFGYRRTHVDCKITEKGAATIDRILYVEAFSTISELNTFLMSPETKPDSPEFKDNVKIKHQNITDMNLQYHVKIVAKQEKEGNLSAKLRISPSLNPGEQIPIHITEYVSSNMYAIDLTEDQLKERTILTDYFGWQVSRPTADLLLRITFPRGVDPQKFDGEVRFAPLHDYSDKVILQHPERKRIDVAKEEINGQVTIKLAIDYPVIGLIYMLYWEPVPKDSSEGDVTTANATMPQAV